MTVFSQILAAFVTAHVLGDFVLQTERDVDRKDQGGVLLKHGAIHAVLTVFLAGSGMLWLPALAIACTHVAIDFGKQRLSNGGWRAFLIDQALHLFILAIAAGLSIRIGLVDPSVWTRLLGDVYFQLLAVAGGLIATVAAGAYFVDLAVEPFLTQIRAGRTDHGASGRPFAATERAASERLRGLRDGGRTIGQLERALIFVFVLIDQFSAIGFLIAAKSIFRFGELRDRSNRMEAEYIIIGTLISFLWAIVAALLTRRLAGL